jgi:hypothetical protein
MKKRIVRKDSVIEGVIVLMLSIVCAALIAILVQ